MRIRLYPEWASTALFSVVLFGAVALGVSGLALSALFVAVYLMAHRVTIAVANRMLREPQGRLP